MADLLDYVRVWVTNFQQNFGEALSRMTPEKYIRLIAIIGAYILIRPYIVKLGSRLQTKEHEKELDPQEMVKPAAISPNALRGQVKVPEDSDEDKDENETSATGADWGKKARKRQRQMVKKILEVEENLRREQQEDNEDKDIEEFLVDE